VIELKTQAGEAAIIAAIPFAAPRTLVTALQLAADDTAAMQRYADRLRQVIQLCSRRFRTDAVNLLCLHTHLDGAVFTGSERRVHLGDDWAATPQALPAIAHYVALGHIHKPQAVIAPSPAEYAGSPLQLDFGEAGEAKSFVRIDAVAGRPAQIHRVPYRGGRPLAIVRATLEELAARRDELAAAGWLKVIALLAAPDPELSRKVHALLDNVVTVDFECPAAERDATTGPTLRDAAPADVYRAWFERTHGRLPDDAVVAAFNQLLADAGGS
jgi:exonuclease SbcD